MPWPGKQDIILMGKGLFHALKRDYALFFTYYIQKLAISAQRANIPGSPSFFLTGRIFPNQSFPWNIIFVQIRHTPPAT